ncbi:MAG: type II toxin-antitoxin system MqsR family toxin, partial [Pseudohongiella sp.]|nr:type II toxin-antitoxin system MqsR family toxin [Pseudohongiella sp.]
PSQMTASIPLKTVRHMIDAKKYRINSNAFDDASVDFGWGDLEICQAICKLKSSQCYASTPHLKIPGCMVDCYRAPKLYKNENVYTHFYINGDLLIINSFKELYK